MSSSRATMVGKGVMEFIGTALFVLTIEVSVGSGKSPGFGAPVAIGVILTALVYAGGPVSGAHYNPAISLAVFLRGKISMHGMTMYWLCQLLGGAVGAVVGSIMLGVNPEDRPSVAIGEGYTLFSAILAEIVFTFMLCFVVLAVATHGGADGNSYFGAAIGLVVMAGAITVGPISGGAFNPAVALGLGVAARSIDSYTLTVIASNLVGGILAAGAFYLAAPDQYASLRTETEIASETTNLL